MKIKKIITLSFLLMGIIVTFIFYNYRRDKVDVFGVNYYLVKTIYKIDSDRDFHEDGFSIKIDSISAADALYFTKPPTSFFNDFPKETGHSSQYAIFNWQNTPISVTDTIAVHFIPKIGLQTLERYAFNDEEAIILTKLNEVSKELQTKGNYYAYFFRDHPNGLYGVDLFVINPKKRLIYIMNRQ